MVLKYGYSANFKIYATFPLSTIINYKEFNYKKPRGVEPLHTL